MKIYLAGPLFSVSEREFNRYLAKLLEDLGHNVWLPQDNEPREERSAKSIFLKDVEGIDWADVVVANLDGPDPDSGTCWECGYAYKKKPVVVFRTDFRAGDEGTLAPCNLMLWASASEALSLLPTTTISELASSINWAVREVFRYGNA